MKLIDKIEKLELAISDLKSLHEICNDIEIVTKDGKDYYCSPTVTCNAEDVEILVNSYGGIAYALPFQFYDILIDNSCKRFTVYSTPFKIPIFDLIMNHIEFDNYEGVLKRHPFKPCILKKINLKIINLIKDNKYRFDNEKLPESIKNLSIYF